LIFLDVSTRALDLLLGEVAKKATERLRAVKDITGTKPIDLCEMFSPIGHGWVTTSIPPQHGVTQRNICFQATAIIALLFVTVSAPSET
jgi:hypothetical protein